MKWTRTTVVAFLIIVTLIFHFAVWLFPDPELLIVMRAIQLASAGAFTIRYWGAARIAWKQNFINEQQVYAFCAVLLSFAVAINALWLWAWRAMDEPRIMIDSAAINGYWICLTYVAYTGKIIAPDTARHHTRKAAWQWIGGAIAMSAILSIFGLYGKHWIEAAVNPILPYLTDVPLRLPRWE